MNSDWIDEKKGTARYFRVGVVSFFNARPLIYGLEHHEQVVLKQDVPARLGESLDKGQVHAALVPSIDYQLFPSEWLILPIAAIGSQSEVLTVRIFSRKPLEELDRLACDTDSHTSMVLAQIIWRLRYGRTLEIVPLEDIRSELNRSIVHNPWARATYLYLFREIV